jgi:arginase family enzyme
MQDLLYGDVPTFMELPHARRPADMQQADIAFLGMGYEGVKIDSPHTYLPELAAGAGPESIYYRTGADKAPEAVRRYSIH